MKALRKAGGNWVEGDRFFDREAEVEVLAERVREGVHTLLTAQRRMGKTSLVFDVLHEDLRRAGRRAASLEDVERVYDREMLGIRGQTDLPHYEDRLRMVLGIDGYRVALEVLTEAANNRGRLPGDAIRRYGESLADEARVRREVRRGLDREVRQRESLAGELMADPPLVEDVLHVLEHDGYLARQGDGYRFVSGLLEDWWRVRYGRSGASSAAPGAGPARSARR